MNIMEAIESRRSIRIFLGREIEKEKLDKVAEAFRLAPSARNLQNWKLLIIQDPHKRELVRRAALGEPAMLAEAPVILAAIGSSQGVMTNGHRVDSIDLSIAMSFCVLEAWEQGLGTCWMASYREEDLRKALDLGEDESIAVITPLGYPAEAPDARPRKRADEVVKYL